MKNISKFKIDKTILISLILMAIISILSIRMAQTFLPSHLQDIHIKQIIWYICGFVVAYSLMFFGNDFIYKNAYILYILGIISLILVLIFGNEINSIRAWFEIPGVGTIQPSEFMKIFLIITLSRLLYDYKEKFIKPTLIDEFILLVKCGILVLIPSILTFMQPDTGIVLIYLVITAFILLTSGIRIRWFVIIFIIASIILSSILILFFNFEDLFIEIFSSSLFYRIDRLLDWTNTSGMQLNNSLMAIGQAGLFGNGINSNLIYFPEGQTDFIFASYTSNFGFLGSLILIFIILFFNMRLVNAAQKSNSIMNKFVISGILGMLLFQQIQNISMTIGLLPITGITLPFISYGGSSLLSYMIMMGIVFNITNENMRYTN